MTSGTAWKVTGAEAMFAAHNHLWFKQQPSEGGTWQIIARQRGQLARGGRDRRGRLLWIYLGDGLSEWARSGAQYRSGCSKGRVHGAIGGLSHLTTRHRRSESLK